MKKFYYVPLDNIIYKLPAKDNIEEVEDKIFWEQFDWNKVKEKLHIKDQWKLIIFYEVVINGLTYKEIQKKYGVSKPTIIKSLNHITKILKEYFL